MASGALSSGAAAGDGGGPRFGCRRRNSWLGVCPKCWICSSTACVNYIDEHKHLFVSNLWLGTVRTEHCVHTCCSQHKTHIVLARLQTPESDSADPVPSKLPCTNHNEKVASLCFVAVRVCSFRI